MGPAVMPLHRCTKIIYIILQLYPISNGIAMVFTSVWEMMCNSYLEVQDPHFTLKVLAFSHFSENVLYVEGLRKLPIRSLQKFHLLELESGNFLLRNSTF
jgi:hypothetical protein